MHPLFVFCFCLAFGALLAHAEPRLPTLRSKVEEPVLEEMMGGCSLNCAFSWTAEVTVGPNRKAASTKALNDDSAITAWTVPEPHTGVGVRVTLVFPKKLMRELEGTPLYGLDFINGDWKTEDGPGFGRIKKLRLSYNDRPFGIVNLANSRRWQRVTFPDFYVKSGDSMSLEILEIYPGEKPGVALSEIVLQGAH